MTARERILWAIEWTRPQAVVWEEEGQELEVALFVRAVAAAERSKATAADRGLVLRYMDDLGISRAGMARNRWTIGQADPIDDARHTPAPPAGSSAKARLRALDGGAA